jgi:hypothetical protein
MTVPRRASLRTGAAGLVALVVMLALFQPDKTAEAANLPTPLDETKVVTYVPEVPAGAARSGSCWTPSVAVLRAGAWRCMVGNWIQDPCFSVASLTGSVVCGANPAARKSGFVMKLDKPLPSTPPAASSKRWPWILELADGTVCEKMTGTMAAIGGESVGWGCSDSRVNAKPVAQQYYSGVLGDPKPGRIWTVEKIKFRSTRDPARPFKVLTRQTMAVRTVWE